MNVRKIFEILIKLLLDRNVEIKSEVVALTQQIFFPHLGPHMNWSTQFKTFFKFRHSKFRHFLLNKMLKLFQGI